MKIILFFFISLEVHAFERGVHDKGFTFLKSKFIFLEKGITKGWFM